MSNETLRHDSVINQTIFSFDMVYQYLSDCSAVIWDDSYLSYPHLVEGNEEDESEQDVFLILELDDPESTTVTMEFIKKDNLEVKKIGKSFWLTNTLGEEIQITPLSPMWNKS
jgi:hypothetical protein